MKVGVNGWERADVEHSHLEAKLRALRIISKALRTIELKLDAEPDNIAVALDALRALQGQDGIA